MSKMNSIERSKYIDKRYKEYLRSTFHFGSAKIQGMFEEQLDKEKLFKGPYVDLSLEFQRGKSLNQLMEEGTVSRLFRNLGDIDFDRPLYAHQEESIRHICSGHNAVITTGTGSGKTESFLFPILNELLYDLESRNTAVGVRAVFLYPMNALVNDQVRRLREILRRFPDVTYGFFTGDTPETASQNYRNSYAAENETEIPENEILSRKEIRENPPHILFTNYTMLEYLLIRPNDYAILSKERLSNWKFVVLDEAHTYHGSLGIEISMLMRRLTGLTQQKPRFILTSATLGVQGKSENDIVEFASNLTSVNFNVSDIIFSKRIPLSNSTAKYRIDGNDYLAIKKDLSLVKIIADKYSVESCDDNHALLFDLLSNDINVETIYNVLKDGSKSFYTLLNQFEGIINEEQLIALIDLINIAEKNHIGLFSLKYHSFVRPISGAYITLGKDSALTLTKTNTLNESKAFEVGNCRYCNAPYIIGKIHHNRHNDLDFLFQNKEIDIYENYGDNEHVSLDYFLLSNDNVDEEDQDSLEEYKICVKCGCLYPSGNLNAEHCECGKEYETTIYRVVTNSEGEDYSARNNLKKCLCCGHKHKTGLIKTLNLGKDEGTALIAQILLEAIDDDEIQPQLPVKLSLTQRPKQSNIERKVKQFLSFSDSRQQAAFFATFLDSNHTRMLQKRLIWDAIEQYGYKELSVDELASVLECTIKKYQLFDNGLSPHKNAWITLLTELLRVDGSYDGEGLGLYFFDLNIDDVMSQLTETDVYENFGRYNITKKDLKEVLQVIFGVFKTTPAISYTLSTLTPEEKRDYLDYRAFDNLISFKLPKNTRNANKAKNIRSFLPIDRSDNYVVRYIEKTFGCTAEEAAGVLDMLFNNLGIPSGILEKTSSQNGYKIQASKYVLKNYKTSTFYRCNKCGGLTPHNVHNVCVNDKCDGVLEPVNPDEALESNFYRQQYKTKKIERIVVKEHTAQLSKKEAKQYQNDFKNKKINILSCSTTFEMGIDIGALETVFMRNIPPTPANYVQRAGRAGRRRDSSAYILTYCGTGSHDYTYFLEPEKMISGIIRPPYFNVLNKKIIIRHLMAACLGFFFRKYPAYYDSIEGLVFGNGGSHFKDYINTHPEELNDYINNGILPESVYSEYHDFKWFDEMGGDDEKLNHFIDAVKEVSKEYEEAMQRAKDEERFDDATYYQKQIEHLHKLKVLESLSKYCVIPKYGFPVDLVDLQVYKNGVLDNSTDLNRDLRIAISEYAPDSEIIVNKVKHTSKYITLPKTSQFPRRYFHFCNHCKKVNLFVDGGDNRNCRYCGEAFDGAVSEYFIEPTLGFKTGVTKKSNRMKPIRSYSGEVSYIGKGISDQNLVSIRDSIFVETSSNDELLIMNKSDFYVCPICGYGKIADKKTFAPQLSESHKNYRMFDCIGTELNRLKLGHRFQTDVARFTIPSLTSLEYDHYSKALSFMYAFLEGISKALEIERTDIDGIVEMNLEMQSYDILIYDNVPGGAGHVKRLATQNAIISALQEALFKVSQNCCDEETTCYNCLRNYYNQSYHSRLKRKYAKEFIETLLSKLK